MSYSLIIIAVLTLALIGLVAGLLLSTATRRLPAKEGDLVERINDLLPQTQCAQCGYPGCRPYAAALADGDAAINLCPPGGTETVRRLAEMLGKPIEPVLVTAVPSVAVIDETRCIGCTHCHQGLSGGCDIWCAPIDAHRH